MSRYGMFNLIDELSNQIDLDNDIRWMKSGNGISALPVMLNVTDGIGLYLLKQYLIRRC